jgi:hypothetical protein
MTGRHSPSLPASAQAWRDVTSGDRAHNGLDENRSVISLDLGSLDLGSLD